MSEFQVHVCSQGEVEVPYSWAIKEQWNPGVVDSSITKENFHSNLYVGKLNNEIVSCLMMTPHEENKFGWVGLYIVKEEHRGKGYGIKTWEFATKDYLNRYGVDSGLGLSGVLAQVKNYEKSGFVYYFKDVRHNASVGDILSIHSKEVGDSQVEKKSKDGKIQIVPLSTVSLDDLANYDEGVVHFKRNKKYLQSWHSDNRFSSFAALSDGKLVGYGSIREAIDGYRLNPLIADNSEVAKLLFLNLVASAQSNSGQVYVDVPEVNEEANKLMSHFGLKPGFPCARMFTKAPLKEDNSKIFGIGNWEVTF